LEVATTAHLEVPFEVVITGKIFVAAGKYVTIDSKP
jgi:hypothetical protein